MNIHTTLELKDFKRIQDTPLTQDSFDEIQTFPECGGIGIFIGTVRNHHEGRAVKALKYTSYAPVSEKMIRQIEKEIQQKHGISYVRVIHRVGALDIGEKAIIAIAYAAHRREAFAACEEAVERVKHEVPVWKEEFYMDGTSEYVAGCCIRRDFDSADQPSDQALHQRFYQMTDHQSHHHVQGSHHCERDHGHPHHHHSHERENLHDQDHSKQKSADSDQRIYQWHM